VNPAALRINTRVTGLRLADFRNFAALQLELPATTVALVGDNGVGKTNLLEALSFLSPGRGLRRASYEAVARIGGAGGWAVAADVEGAVGPVRIGTGLEPGGETLRRVRIDGAPQRSAEALNEHLRVLWLTPAMDGLFTGPPGERRRFLDRLVLAIDPGHGRRVAAYETAVTNRNRLLEDPRAAPAWFDAAEAELAGLAVAVAAARNELVGLIGGLLAETAGPFPRAGLTIDGDVERALGEAVAADAEDALRRDYAARRSRDRAAGRTTLGPHRSDLTVVHAEKGMPAALSSTGEQKALLIGLTLAHARLVAGVTGLVPILLLDEVAAHLDGIRRAALYAEIEAIGAQGFLTGTDAGLFEALTGRAAFLKVEAGGSVVPL
jgi:DNA replication and repair protein RecF